MTARIFVMLEGWNQQKWTVEIPAEQPKESLLRVCEVFGASNLRSMTGRCVRVIVSEDGRISDIGNATADVWLEGSDCMSLELDPKNEP